ncbi:MAG: cytochrome c binding [Prolixibacteraceae bacterium]|nr:MAG: cytochrome c binding [Prolixibacteraceae bacterium]
MRIRKITLLIILASFIAACSTKPNGNTAWINNRPVIGPDYSGLTIPINIAPLNFTIEENGDAFFVRILDEKGVSIEVSDKRGIIKIPEKKWKNLLRDNKSKKLFYQVYVKRGGEWSQFEPFSNTISDSPVAPYLYYRLLFPGYESWGEISIMQRSLESFEEKVVVQNNVVGQNCVNCHAVNLQNPDNFMFHMRGSRGGTYFVADGDLKKFNLKTKEMENSATYPRWHPSGKYVAFSSNKVVQQFHSLESKKIEVTDLASALVLYDLAKNEIMEIQVNQKRQFMDTYPEWSPAGDWLYFCRAAQIEKEYDYRDIKYNLYRVNFNPSNRTFGEVEMVFDAAALGKSVSFPRVSPNGKLLVFTLHDYGCFPVWHKEADLYSIKPDDFSVAKLEVNSDFSESYHSWSANGRWLVFSSKRGDGLSARPYISYVDENGVALKPFVLPQENPKFYNRFLKTFNIPEFAESEFSFTPGEIRKAARQEAIQPKWSDK